MSPDYIEHAKFLVVGFLALFTILLAICSVKIHEAETEIGERVSPMDEDIEFDPQTGMYVTAYVWDGTRYYSTSRKRQRLQRKLAKIERLRKTKGGY